MCSCIGVAGGFTYSNLCNIFSNVSKVDIMVRLVKLLSFASFVSHSSLVILVMLALLAMLALSCQPRQSCYPSYSSRSGGIFSYSLVLIDNGQDPIQCRSSGLQKAHRSNITRLCRVMRPSQPIPAQLDRGPQNLIQSTNDLLDSLLFKRN